MVAGTADAPHRGLDEREIITRDDRALDRLRVYNIVMGLAHLVQAITVLLLSNDFDLPVTTSAPTDAPGPADPVFEIWFRLALGPMVAVFFLISAANHILMATPGIFPWYRRNLQRGIHYTRWVEYALSAGLMMVLISMVTSISDYRALAGIFGLTAAMNLFGFMQERHTIDRRLAGKNVNWSAFWFGTWIGLIPWVLVFMTTLNVPGEFDGVGEVPRFVWGIFASLLLFFSSFAVNMLLQYRGVGPWRDYLFGERVYMWLSLIAKGALAWQIFANTLID